MSVALQEEEQLNLALLFDWVHMYSMYLVASGGSVKKSHQIRKQDSVWGLFVFM